jgi:hypothetical protein
MNKEEFDALEPDETIVRYVGYSRGHGLERGSHAGLSGFFDRRAIVRRTGPGPELIGMDVEVQFSGENHSWVGGPRKTISAGFLEIEPQAGDGFVEVRIGDIWEYLGVEATSHLKGDQRMVAGELENSNGKYRMVGVDYYPAGLLNTMTAEDINRQMKLIGRKGNTMGNTPEVEETKPDLVEETDDQAAAQDLRAWWLDLASEEVEPMIAKALEYAGGSDRDSNLVKLGEQMIAAGVLPVDYELPEPSVYKGDDQYNAYAAELAIYFYVQGKMARWAAAVAAGRPVSDDTILDIGVYARMVQRIRATGGWPR